MPPYSAWDQAAALQNPFAPQRPFGGQRIPNQPPAYQPGPGITQGGKDAQGQGGWATGIIPPASQQASAFGGAPAGQVGGGGAGNVDMATAQWLKRLGVTDEELATMSPADLEDTKRWARRQAFKQPTQPPPEAPPLTPPTGSPPGTTPPAGGGKPAAPVQKPGPGWTTPEGPLPGGGRPPGSGLAADQKRAFQPVVNPGIGTGWWDQVGRGATRRDYMTNAMPGGPQ